MCVLPCPQRSHPSLDSHARTSREAQAASFAFPETSSQSPDPVRCSVATFK